VVIIINDILSSNSLNLSKQFVFGNNFIHFFQQKEFEKKYTTNNYSKLPIYFGYLNYSMYSKISSAVTTTITSPNNNNNNNNNINNETNNQNNPNNAKNNKTKNNENQNTHFHNTKTPLIWNRCLCVLTNSDTLDLYANHIDYHIQSLLQQYTLLYKTQQTLNQINLQNKTNNQESNNNQNNPTQKKSFFGNESTNNNDKKLLSFGPQKLDDIDTNNVNNINQLFLSLPPPPKSISTLITSINLKKSTIAIVPNDRFGVKFLISITPHEQNDGGGELLFACKDTIGFEKWVFKILGTK